MKKVFFSVAALAAAMSFTACSSEDGLDQAQSSVWNEDGTGYMAFNISMPQSNSGRANDVFEPGETSEYAVNNAVLFIFQGNDEPNATFHSAYVLTDDGNWGTGQPGNITVDKKLVAKLEGAPEISTMKAFVVLNNNGIFVVDDATHTVKINGVNFPVGHTFSEFQALTNKVDTPLDLNATAFTNGGILMMNAPLYSTGGENMSPVSGDLRVLSTVYSNNIYKTETEAQNGVAATSVYVERAVAKVSVKQAEGGLTTAPTFSAVLNGWTLDNTNKSSYLLRSVEDFKSWVGYEANGKFRMVGKTTVGHDSPITEGTQAHNGYRTYYAKDLNFGTDCTYGVDLNSANPANLSAIGGYQYCAENTFDVERMKYKNTTRVLIKATLTPSNDALNIDGAGFYSKAGDDKFYTEAQMSILVQNHVNSILSSLASADKLEGLGSVNYTTNTTDHKTFTVKVTGISYDPVQSALPAEKQLTTEEKELVDALIDGTQEYSIHTIGYDFYEGGVCYYDARILHFGEDHTPWTPKEASTVTEAYGADLSPEAYLGRWSVLRNNWYQLEVGSINKIGYAHPENLSFDPDSPYPNPDPNYPDTPDDNQKSEQWIAVDVNILSWAVRNQAVIL